MTASDLGRLLGNRQLGSADPRCQRQLSKEHVLKLADHFKVSTDPLLRPATKETQGGHPEVTDRYNVAAATVFTNSAGGITEIPRTV